MSHRKKRSETCPNRNITPPFGLKSARLQLSPSPYSSGSPSSPSPAMRWSLVSSHLWVRKKNKLPRLPQLRHNSRVGQSTSSCPGLLRRHFPHHVGIEGVAASASVTVRCRGGGMASRLNRHCGER